MARSFVPFGLPPLGEDAGRAAAQIHLLGRTPLDDVLRLQDRLAQETRFRQDLRITVLLCDHPPAITVGRCGSRGDIRASDQDLRRREVAVRWVARGGGCLVHAPGQLAAYVIAPLDRWGWTPGQFIRRLHGAAVETLRTLDISPETPPAGWDVWGRSGLLAALGVGVRHGVSRFGLYVNVNPAMQLQRLVAPPGAGPARAGRRAEMGCLLAERRRPVTMPQVRAALGPILADVLDCPDYYLHTGHPWLPSRRSSPQPESRRA